jgi:hypothetical protein
MKEPVKPSSRIFSYLVDKAAFVDKIAVSVTGTLNETFRENELLNVDPKSIFRPGGLYGGCIFARWGKTGNPVLIHHGRMTKFKNVPPLRFTEKSETIPVTAAQVQLFIKRCTSEVPEVSTSVSYLELTFDVTDTTIGYVRRHLIHRALGGERIFIDDRGFETVYVGSPSSSWEVRIYQNKSVGGTNRIRSP